MGFSTTQIQSQDFYKVFFLTFIKLITFNSIYYELKVPFLEVLELVKSRRVFVKNGFAFVTIQDFGSVLLHAFRTHLSKSLSVINFKQTYSKFLIMIWTKKTLSKFAKEFEDDPRMSELFRILRERDTSDNFANSEAKDHLTSDSLDPVIFFPFYFIESLIN